MQYDHKSSLIVYKLTHKHTKRALYVIGGYSNFAFMQRLKSLCQAESSWGPALEQNWKNVEYYPAVNTTTLAVDVGNSPLHTVTGIH